MKIMIDTNILGRLADKHSSQHTEAKTVISILHKQQCQFYFTPQIKREFLNFAERPQGSGVEQNGIGFTKEQSIFILNHFKTQMIYIHDIVEIDRCFDQLHKQFGGGRNVHDLYIAASMIAHYINTILTYNEKDFKSVEDAGFIQILTPSTVLQNSI